MKSYFFKFQKIYSANVIFRKFCDLLFLVLNAALFVLIAAIVNNIKQESVYIASEMPCVCLWLLQN